MQITLKAPRVITTSPTAISQICMYNPNASEVFLKFFDTDKGITLGSSIPSYTLQLVSISTLTLDKREFQIPIFEKGLTLAVTQSSDPTSTAVPALDLTITLTLL